jgi:hypothetical protein
MTANTNENVVTGYPLVSRALRYLAMKIRTVKDDEGIKVRDELVSEGLEHKAESIEEIAKFDDQMAYLQSRPKSNEDSEVLAKRDNRFSDPYRKIVCFALAMYGGDLAQSNGAIPERIMSLNPSDHEELKAMLKIDDIDSQLRNIEEVMIKDYCGK